MIADNTMDTGSDQDEEEKALDPDHLEERFRVDRRKLEQMIQAHCDLEEDGTADDFFHKVMEDTNTRITWPSKLKIGAKSKKDPHIKVSGHKDAVANAKDRIMAVLDTKSSRVTLKMDVSHIEHSHVIGKGGYNIKRVMQETGCHIHFPDSNRNTQAEKSNQVSIAGQPKGVEQARQKIRELLPLVFMFELPVAGLLQPLPDTSSPQIQQIQNTYGVTISFKQRSQVYMTTVIIRGSVCNSKSVKDATIVLIEHLTGSVGTTVPVSMQLDIAPQHHLFIIGRAGANIKHIMQLTGATIHFPDPSNSAPQRKGTVYITGSIDSVLLARQQLIGCLPLVLMFDMKEDTEIEQAKIGHLMEQLDVYISIKPKPKQPSKSVIVKSIERNIGNLYEARSRLLGVTSERPMVQPPTLYAAACNGNRPISNFVYRPMMVLAPQTGFTQIHTAAAYPVYPHNGLKPDANFVKHNGLKVDIVQASLCSKPATISGASQALQSDLSSKVSRASPSMSSASVPSASLASACLSSRSMPSPTTSSPNAPSTPSNSSCVSSPTMLRALQAPNLAQARHNGDQLPDLGAHSLASHLRVGSPGSLSDISNDDAVASVEEVTSPDTLELLNNVMSMSLLQNSASLHSMTTPIPNLSFTKNDIQDAVSSIQSKPNLLHQMRPTEHSQEQRNISNDILQQLRPTEHLKDRNTTTEYNRQFRPVNHIQDDRTISTELFDNSSTDIDPIVGSLSHIGSPNSALNGSGPRRVKTPPGFSGPPRGHKERSPMRQFTSHFDSSQYRYDSNTRTNQLSGIPGSSMPHDLDSNSPLGYGSTAIRHGMDSPLGCLGSPLAPRGSPLGSGGSPRATQGSPINRGHPRHFQNGDTRSSESGCDSDGSDCRAPGSNRPQKLLADLFPPQTAGFSTFDYEQKKLLATKAMQKKPEGESRIPTDFWSGLGFSKSMPDSAIRERLKSNNVRYHGPTMTTTYECAYDEMEGDGWVEGLSEEGTELTDGDALPNHISAAPGEYPSMRRKGAEHSPLHSNNHSTDEGMMTRSPLHSSSNGQDDGMMTRSPLHSSSQGTDEGMMTRSPLHSSSSRADDRIRTRTSQEWTRQPDLVELFSKLGLGKYTDLFTQQEIDLCTFLTLTDQDLKELGITTFGARRKMLIAIADLNKRQTLLRTSAVGGTSNPFGDAESTLMHNSRPRHDIASQSGRW